MTRTIGLDQNGEHRIAISAQELSDLATAVFGPSRAPGLVAHKIEWQHGLAPNGYSVLVLVFKRDEETQAKRAEFEALAKKVGAPGVTVLASSGEALPADVRAKIGEEPK